MEIFVNNHGERDLQESARISHFSICLLIQTLPFYNNYNYWNNLQLEKFFIKQEKNWQFYSCYDGEFKFW